jgi:putative heme iron utilization protein
MQFRLPLRAKKHFLPPLPTDKQLNNVRATPFKTFYFLVSEQERHAISFGNGPVSSS